MAKAASEVRDPVCGKPVDPLRARAVGIFGGVTYYFCSAECKSKYKDPRKEPRPSQSGAPASTSSSVRQQAAEEAKATKSTPPPAAPVAAPTPDAVPAAPDRTLDAWVATAPKSVEASAELNLRDADHDENGAPTEAPAPPSPSLAAELKATRPSPRRAWVYVSLLFVLAAAVLFFSLRSR